MSGDGDTNDVTQVTELRRVFEESASQEIMTIQEMDRSLTEVSDFIEQMQRFFSKKSSDIKDLRQTISDPTTRRVTSGYSMAKDMIQKLEKKVAEKAKDLIRLRKDVSQKDQQLSMAERIAEEKQKLIEERERQIIELRERQQERDRTSKNQTPQINEQETNNNDYDTNEKIEELREAIMDRDGAIERLNDIINQLQKDLSDKETQQYMNKQLSNTMKIRQLEPLAKQFPEIEEFLNKLKEETAIIVERLVNANNCPATDANVPTSRTPDKLLRG
jgi:DNA repair exonuclease SbcCD ATPase subunit